MTGVADAMATVGQSARKSGPESWRRFTCPGQGGKIVVSRMASATGPDMTAGSVS